MTMSYWANLNQAIEATIISGQIGTPVFGRVTLVLAETPAKESQVTAALVYDLSRWFSAMPCRLYAQPSPKATHLSLGVEYPTGAMALISLVLGQMQAHLDLTLVGNVGAVYHRESLNLAGQPFVAVDLVDGALNLQPSIEVALLTDTPVTLKVADKA